MAPSPGGPAGANRVAGTNVAAGANAIAGTLGLAILSLALALAVVCRQLAAARIDSLTRVHNRHWLTDRRRCARAVNVGGWVAFVDVDGLKMVNDQLSHADGDRVLAAVAGAIRGAIRPNDTVVRHGGDEFVVVLGPCGQSGAESVAHRVRRAVEALPDPGHGRQVTVSIGLCPLSGGHPGLLVCRTMSVAEHHMAAAVGVADRAMAVAKGMGGNAVAIDGGSRDPVVVPPGFDMQSVT